MENLQPLCLKERTEIRLCQDGGVEFPVGFRTGGGEATCTPKGVPKETKRAAWSEVVGRWATEETEERRRGGT